MCVLTRELKRRELTQFHQREWPDHCMLSYPLLRDQPLLAELYGASVQGRIATGARLGNRITALGAQIEPENPAIPAGTRCAGVSGVSLHANVCIPAKARRQLEKLCRYAARPPIATERLSILPDGRVLYRLRHRWRDGTTHVAFEPLELVEKLPALVPRPMFNLVRYHGILAPAARWRPFLVPFDPEATNSVHHSGCGAGKQLDHPESSQKPRRCHRRNYTGLN